MKDGDDDQMFEKVIENCEKDRRLIEDIKTRLNNKNSLDQFTLIQFEISAGCRANIEAKFIQLLRRKMKAQSILNLYYENDHYKACTLTESLNMPSSTDNPFEKNEVLNGITPIIDTVVSAILRYIVIFQILSTHEARQMINKCTYCDNNLGKDDIRCYVCLTTITLDMCLLDRDITNSSDYNSIDSSKSKKTASSSWKCSACTFNNKLSNDICAVCLQDTFESVTKSNEIVKDEIKLSNSQVTQRNESICPSCTFVNKLQNRKCEVCFTPLKKDSLHSDDLSDSRDLKKKPWNCKHCHREYSFDKYMCTICRKYAPFLNVWICESCFLENDKIIKLCLKCKNRNIHLMLCSKCKSNTINKDIDDVCDDCNVNILGRIVSPEIKKRTSLRTKKKSDFTEYDVLDKRSGEIEIIAWNCTFCEELNNGNNCKKCKNMWHRPKHIICSCNWSNLHSKVFCGNCYKIIDHSS